MCLTNLQGDCKLFEGLDCIFIFMSLESSIGHDRINEKIMHFIKC